MEQSHEGHGPDHHRQETTVPTRVLRDEHRVVQLVVQAMAREADAVAGGAPVGRQRVADMIDFTRSFTDGCHHLKEERLLFPRLRERSPGAEAPIAMMLAEHELGREHMRAIEAAPPPPPDGDREASADVAANLRDYASLLETHIRKEDSVLFPLADRILTAEDRAHLAKEFELVEAEEVGAGVHERYHALAEELAGGGHSHSG